MRILFSGGSSFTGFWFIQELAKAGHQVIACFQKPIQDYEGVRRERINLIVEFCQPVFNCSFGSERFLSLIEEDTIDIYCHHAADVTNYKDPEFDILKAVANNTFNIKAIVKALKNHGCSRIVLTGTVFEPNEGQGSDGLRAVSPYGLSKGMTFELFRFVCEHYGMGLGKFVIANPFGPYEEDRFTSYLIKAWFSGKTALVSTPEYIRDNIPVSLLSKAYQKYVERPGNSAGYSKFNPSGYVETQREFALRFAHEMRIRLDLPCPLEFKMQTEFVEPKVRVNIDQIDAVSLNWNENEAWDDLACYYQRRNTE